MARTLAARLRDGRTVLGTFVQTPSPVVCEVAGRLGFDALCIEAEHSAIDRADVHALVAATESTPAEPLVRVPGNDPVAIAGALDAGAAGVIVPRVGSAAEARAAVSAARFPPEGARGVGPARAALYGADRGAYLQEANASVLVGVQVETAAAVERLDELLAVEGLDMLFVGPNDLALSLGLAGGADDPALEGIVTDIVARTRAAGRIAGGFATTADGARRWIEQGAGLVLVGSDLLLLARGAAAVLDELRGATGAGA